ncbi:hypothetical protein BDZ89DRAFT_447573 [Hymenopellis radicata]|nr:hypothetical protein BDZ89DRAFT_447573 [Hymenopellis radicata]
MTVVVETHSLSFTSEAHKSSPSPSSSPPKRSRGSLLLVASDALGIRFGKRRKSIRQPPMPIILPGVIEITAPRPDAEEEERQQLRDAAVQAIGLTSSLLQPPPPPVDADESHCKAEPDERDFAETLTTVSEQPLTPPMSPLSSTYSAQNSMLVGRHRAASVLSHSRSTSITPAPIPPFPASPADLAQFVQASATLPKYYAPSSLRIFALSRQWKSRYVILSQPTALATTNSKPTVSYLHLYKTANGDERELERLEINEDSVVFVAEEEVSGRRQVVKVGGTDVGARRKELNHEEGGRTMWFLQICDQGEAQRWIATIKQSIFGQRAVRAGLGSPGSNCAGVEPRGDIDVMLSMRAQGIINSPREKFNIQEFNNALHSPSSSREETFSSSSSSNSIRSQPATPKAAPAGAVSTLKGLFTGTRSRSGSRSTSIESDSLDNEDTFGSMGTNLLNMSHPSIPIVTAKDLDRKIITDDELDEAPGIPHPFSAHFYRERSNRTLSMGAVPLQPPPRTKRWTATGNLTTDMTSVYKHVNGNQSDICVSHDRGATEPSPTLLTNGFRTPEQKPREPSIRSVSTLASVDGASVSTKRSSSVKRWSRQLPLPKRLTPPIGPPPAIPTNLSPPRPHPYAGDRPPSRESSVYSANSGKSHGSAVPFFSKRASGSSYMSVTSTSTSAHSVAPSQTSSIVSHTRAGSSHRTSIPPPPRPAPTSALPPAPVEQPSVRKATKSFRMSLMAPKPPPSIAPPPTPSDYRSRRSSASASVKSSLAPIPSSPNPSLSPLRQSQQTTPTPSVSSSRASSLKHRLRILSAPSPTNLSNGHLSPLMTPTPPITPTSLSPTATLGNTIHNGLGDKFNYDHSYLQLYTPITPTAPKGHVPLSIDDEPVLRSLSPPPRRMSRQINAHEKEAVFERVAPENVPLPLSPRGSVISLGLLTM